PTFSLQDDAVVLLRGDEIVAHAETCASRGEINVSPRVRGFGVGTRLMQWVEERGRAKGEREIRQTVFDTAASSVAVLLANGYRVAYTSWILEIPLDERPPDPRPPPGIEIRAYRPGAEDREVYRIIEDAFNELPGRVATPFEDWAATSILRADFEHSLLQVAVDGDTLVGACIGFNYEDEGVWVQQLAVKASHRNRGIAQALLQQAFLVSWERGEPASGLSTDSRTGALSLYESVGMRIKHSATNYTKDL
ncbi:MAG: hypothetical protein QOH26_60, partial [Actinomycetota bacterium]|nr:hypothetical protein [Actinomycetota bacterium]